MFYSCSNGNESNLQTTSEIVENVTANPEIIENISFASDGIVLKGTLEIPAGNSPHPLMVFVHGSGRVTRSAYQSYYSEFYPNGYAIFRYDKRGVGESGGVYTEVPAFNSNEILPLLAKDANAAIQVLKKHKHIDSTQIIIIGASQAGWIIPIAANLSENVAFNVLVSGPTVTVGIENYYSYLTDNTNDSDSVISEKLKQYNGIQGFDPVPSIKKMKQPSLWLLGGKDRSIPSKESIEILNKIIVEENKPFEIKFYPDANHGLINSNGNREPYLDYINTWLQSKIQY
ncbi:MAG: hypothetical protein A2068_03330 [Ignavibacteria bacterium GWB2_35_6b]|nr:MAG: hypothetical protein A2068_03330 [Ignavibacteria bacterium GWB2_35_6b]